MDITRRKTPTVKVGNVLMGSNYPIVIQSMTDTPTGNITATAKQIKELVYEGAELVRITINNDAAMRAVPKIIKTLKKKSVYVPLIGDFHYNGHILLAKYPESAKLISKYRINPGNVGRVKAHDKNFETIIKIAIKNNKPVRIGVNSGSVDPQMLAYMMNKNARLKIPKLANEVLRDAMVKSALDSAAAARKIGLAKNKIVLSVKCTDVGCMIAANRQLAQQCDYVLHLGLTEAGSGTRGVIYSATGLGPLLQEGIGDTIRISLTPQAGLDRTFEVEVCKALLQSLGLRYFSPTVVSCPGCGRTKSKDFQRLATDIQTHVTRRLKTWKKKYKGVERITIAVMGCVVNGPGESKHADIGISLPGATEKPVAVVYADGKKIASLKGKNIKGKFMGILEKYIAKKRKN